MTYNRDKAFENEDGIVLNDTVHVVGGAGAPSASFPSPSAFSFYIQDNGSIWFWTTGPWTRISGNKNFSIHRLSEELTIESGQHMLTCQLEITLTGALELELDSSLVVLL